MRRSKSGHEGAGESGVECRLYVDLDDVLCETMRGFLRLLADTLGKRIAYRDVFSFDLQRSFCLTPLEAERFFEACHAPEVLIQLTPAQFAAGILADWRHAGHCVTIVTGRPPHTRIVTQEWLKLNKMPYSELLFVDKYGRHPEIMPLKDLPLDLFTLAIEDNANVASELARRNGPLVALLTRPWNRSGTFGASRKDQIVRCRTWKDIALVCAKVCERGLQ